MSAQQEQQIVDECPISHFSMIPHVIDDMGLSPYEYRLYGHLKRVTGESAGGKCWQSTATIADICKMSAGTVSKAKKTLERLGLIRIEKVPGKPGRHFHRITLVNIWQRNAEHFSSSREVQSSPGELQSSHGETKNNPLKNNPPQEKATPSATAKLRSEKQKELDNLKTYLTDHFSKRTAIPPPEYDTQKKAKAAQELWWHPLIQMADTCDRDLERTERLIDWCIKHCDDDGLTMSSPKSIVQIAIAEQAKRKRGNNGRTQGRAGDDLPSITKEQGEILRAHLRARKAAVSAVQ